MTVENASIVEVVPVPVPPARGFIMRRSLIDVEMAATTGKEHEA